MKSRIDPHVIARIADAVGEVGFTLDDEQIHIGGERALMSAHKLVLTGRDTGNGSRVVIKASVDAEGAHDLENEHRIRETLRKLKFAQSELLFPEERWYSEGEGVISVTNYIEQERVFVSFPLRDQFFMALKAFESQEAYHATTHEHVRVLKSIIDVWKSPNYIEDCRLITETVGTHDPSSREVSETLQKVALLLGEHARLIDRYSGYLVHTDFVPHNFRIRNREIHALDQVAIWFGNKYEGWARFVNYMELHNPKLARLIVDYIRTQRGAEDARMLTIMRCYKLAVLLRYYANATRSSEGALRKLSQERFHFWHDVLKHLLAGTPVPEEMITAYKKVRDSLRSPEEIKRQREFATV